MGQLGAERAVRRSSSEDASIITSVRQLEIGETLKIYFRGKLNFSARIEEKRPIGWPGTNRNPAI